MSFCVLALGGRVREVVVLVSQAAVGLAAVIGL